MPAAVNRHLLKLEGFEAGLHVGPSATDPEAVEIQIFEPPGVQASSAFVKKVENHFAPPGFPPRGRGRGGGDPLPVARGARSYAQALLATLDADAIRKPPVPDRRRLRATRPRRSSCRSSSARSAWRRSRPAPTCASGVRAVLERRSTSRSGTRSGSSRRWAPTSASSSTRAPSGSTSWTRTRRRFPPSRRCSSSCAPRAPAARAAWPSL